jgi:hypothetical protein
MRVIARPTASTARRAARSSSLSAPRVCATAILAGVAAGCGVTLPTPPPATTDAERLCVLECQSQHAACVNGGGSPYVQALEPPVMQAWSVERGQTTWRTRSGPTQAEPTRRVGLWGGMIADQPWDGNLRPRPARGPGLHEHERLWPDA